MITAKQTEHDAIDVTIKGKRSIVIAEYKGITRSMLQNEIVDIEELMHIVATVMSMEAEKDA